jgi:AraC-like DNA-binding protein
LKDYENEFADFYYYTPNQWDKDGKFCPVRGGESMTKPGYSVGPKRIECYSMHFVRMGSIQLEYEGKQKTLGAGDIFCLYPWRTYTYRREDQDSALQLCWLALEGPGTESMLTRIGFRREEPYIEKREMPPVYSVLKKMYEKMRKGVPLQMKESFELQALLYQLFSMLIKDDMMSGEFGPSNWVRRSMEYIDLHATEGITVQHVAEIAGVNRTYFSTEFSRQAGCSPSEYITRVRMDKAKEMLSKTSASVTEIAYSLGYPNLFSFTRAFKNRFSLAPTQYRERI